MWHMPYGMTGDLVVSSLYAAKLGQFDQPQMGDLTIMVQPVGVA